MQSNSCWTVKVVFLLELLLWYEDIFRYGLLKIQFLIEYPNIEV